MNPHSNQEKSINNYIYFDSITHENQVFRSIETENLTIEQFQELLNEIQTDSAKKAIDTLTKISDAICIEGELYAKQVDISLIRLLKSHSCTPICEGVLHLFSALIYSTNDFIQFLLDPQWFIQAFQYLNLMDEPSELYFSSILINMRPIFFERNDFAFFAEPKFIKEALKYVSESKDFYKLWFDIYQWDKLNEESFRLLTLYFFQVLRQTTSIEVRKYVLKKLSERANTVFPTLVLYQKMIPVLLHFIENCEEWSARLSIRLISRCMAWSMNDEFFVCVDNFELPQKFLSLLNSDNEKIAISAIEFYSQYFSQIGSFLISSFPVERIFQLYESTDIIQRISIVQFIVSLLQRFQFGEIAELVPFEMIEEICELIDVDSNEAKTNVYTLLSHLFIDESFPPEWKSILADVYGSDEFQEKMHEDIEDNNECALMLSATMRELEVPS